jgi:hypothetical protein
MQRITNWQQSSIEGKETADETAEGERNKGSKRGGEE